MTTWQLNNEKKGVAVKISIGIVQYFSLCKVDCFRKFCAPIKHILQDVSENLQQG